MNPIKRAMFVLTAVSMFVMIADVEAGLFGRRSRGSNCSSGCDSSGCGTSGSCGVGGNPVTFSDDRPDSVSSTTVRAARVSEARQEPAQVAAKVTSPSGFKWSVAPSRIAQKRPVPGRQLPSLDAKSMVIVAILPDLDVPSKTVAIAQIPDLDAPIGRPSLIGTIAQQLPALR